MMLCCIGGPGQLPHLAPTYASVLALCSLGVPEAYKVIDRPALQSFLLSMHQEDGSYIMHEDGEKDIRLSSFKFYCNHELICAWIEEVYM